MFGSRRDRGGEEVVCIACGDRLPRGDAREYDKQGDRWDRHDKEFEYLCSDCHGDLCHQPRDGLEALLADVEGQGDHPTSEAFAAAFQREVADRAAEGETDRDRR